MDTSQTAGAPEYETVTPSRLKTGSRCSSGTGVCRAANSPSLAWDWLATALAVSSCWEASALSTRSGSLTVDIFVDRRSECRLPGLCPGVAVVKMWRSGSSDLLNLAACSERQQPAHDAPDEHNGDQDKGCRPRLLLDVRVG